jgi:hypothetical protein
MFGALFQFVPVITSRKLPSQTLPLATLTREARLDPLKPRRYRP